MSERIHPHSLIADFVNDYEEIIMPSLEEGNLSSALAAAVGKAYECYLEFSVNDLKLIKQGAFTSYEQAVNILNVLSGQIDEIKNIVGKEEFDKGILKPTVRNINIEISKLDIILQGDNDYEDQRRRK